MNSKQLYFLLVGSIGLLTVLLLGGAYAVDQVLTAESKQLVNSRLQDAVLDQEQTELAKAKADIKKYQGLANIAKSVVPQDKDQAQTIRQISSFANANGVPLSSFSFPSSTLGAPKSGDQNLSQLVPVTDVPGVYSLQISVESDTSRPVPYSSFIAFLTALEHNRRTALVQGITIQPSSTDRSKLSFGLMLDEYIKP